MCIPRVFLILKGLKDENSSDIVHGFVDEYPRGPPNIDPWYWKIRKRISTTHSR
jgi:hypothetical protein